MDTMQKAIKIARTALKEVPKKAPKNMRHKGGMARAEALSEADRKKIASKGAKARWKKKLD